MDDADVRIITGDQGSGKSTTGVALVVDDCCDNITGIVSPSGVKYDASPLSSNEISTLKKYGIPYNPHKHIRVFSAGNGESKIVAKPNEYTMESSIKVFANFTFYGIKFVQVDLPMIVENMNTNLFRNCWIVLDESIITERRDTMSNVGKMMAWFGAQARKRTMHMVIIAQYLQMIQSRFNQFAKTRVLCEYNSETKLVSIDVNRKSEVMSSTTYYAPEYWKYFKHDDLIEVPQYRIDKTLEAMYSR